MSKQFINKSVPSTSRVVKAIRISTYHELMFSQMPGKEFPGLLVRLLLDEYFSGKLPELQKKFEVELERKRKERLTILALQAKKNAEKKVIM